MVKPLSDPTPRIRIVRLAVVLACWIMLLTELSQVIERVSGLSPDFPWGARFGLYFRWWWLGFLYSCYYLSHPAGPTQMVRQEVIFVV